jgi:hypothetical protein
MSVELDLSDAGKIFGSHREIHDHVHWDLKTGRGLNL